MLAFLASHSLVAGRDFAMNIALYGSFSTRPLVRIMSLYKLYRVYYWAGKPEPIPSLPIFYFPEGSLVMLRRHLETSAQVLPTEVTLPIHNAGSSIDSEASAH